MKGELPSVVDFERAFQDERDEIFPGLKGRPQPAAGGGPGDPPLSALCLSGGGIRSASFALGVLQGLADIKALHKFHYLSTVSGGGYIGSWLSSLIRLKHGDVEAVERDLVAIPEPAPIGNLREYAMYLTPKAGLASADTWAAAVIVVRNIFLNWFIFAPLLLLTALAVLGYGSVIASTSRDASPVLLALAALLLLVSTTQTCLNLPSHRAPGSQGPDLDCIRWRLVVPSLSWAALVPLAICGEIPDYAFMAALIVPFGLAGSWLGLPLAWLLGAHRPDGTSRLRDGALWLVVSLVSTGLAAGGVLLSGTVGEGWREIVLAVLGPVWLTLCTMIHASLFVAFRRIGNRDLDADREWLARLSAVKLLPTLYWMVLAGAVLALPRAVFVDAGGIGAFITALTGAISAPVAVLGGRSAASVVTGLGGSGEKKAMPFNRVVAIAAAVTIVVLLMAASVVAGSLTAMVAGWLAGLVSAWPADLQRLAAQAVVAVAAGGMLCFASGRINVNRFSLQSFYRNRLVRAFLAAGRPVRKPDHFTGFDGEDNPRMHQFRAEVMARDGGVAPLPRRLLPVVNVTLNLVGGERLAWQQRQAEAFTITPLACGSAMLDLEHNRTEPKGAYVSSLAYGGAESNASQPGDGISLGTAMAISGAAVSPAMGYHSSPPTALLMTLFNARLGCWLPNPVWPDRAYLKRSGPSRALRPLLNEMFGQTTDHQRDIYLSDGGHFDNLGLYEMVRRRCRLIFVSDAGCDPQAQFADLGETARKIRIDLGVDITMSPPLPLNDGAVACATGTIHYPNGAAPGLLVYLRPVLVGNLPIDVLNYSKTNAEFPNDTTADQWFSESQFESYRQLGRYLVGVIQQQRLTDTTLNDFFNRL